MPFWSKRISVGAKTRGGERERRGGDLGLLLATHRSDDKQTFPCTPMSSIAHIQNEHGVLVICH